MLLEISQRVVYGMAGTSALLAVAAVAIGLAPLVVFNPITYMTGACLGLAAPWSKQR